MAAPSAIGAASTTSGGKTLEVVPDEADVLRDAAHKVLAGWSLSNVAADLDRRGVRGANGKRITYGSLARMLTNPTVAGHRVHRGADRQYGCVGADPR